MGINAGGAEYRKHKKTVNESSEKCGNRKTQPLAFIPCYGIGGGIDIDRKDTSPQRGGTWKYDNTKYQPPLYHNYHI